MPILQQFSALTTQGINISNITLAQNPAKISITGTADTRDHYTAYENALQASKILKDVEFPLQTKKTDIEFNMEFTLVLP